MSRGPPASVHTFIGEIKPSTREPKIIQSEPVSKAFGYQTFQFPPKCVCVLSKQTLPCDSSSTSSDSMTRGRPAVWTNASFIYIVPRDGPPNVLLDHLYTLVSIVSERFGVFCLLQVYPSGVTKVTQHPTFTNAVVSATASTTYYTGITIPLVLDGGVSAMADIFFVPIDFIVYSSAESCRDEAPTLVQQFFKSRLQKGTTIQIQIKSSKDDFIAPGVYTVCDVGSSHTEIVATLRHEDGTLYNDVHLENVKWCVHHKNPQDLEYLCNCITTALLHTDTLYTYISFIKSSVSSAMTNTYFWTKMRFFRKSQISCGGQPWHTIENSLSCHTSAFLLFTSFDVYFARYPEMAELAASRVLPVDMVQRPEFMHAQLATGGPDLAKLVTALYPNGLCPPHTSNLELIALCTNFYDIMRCVHNCPDLYAFLYALRKRLFFKPTLFNIAPCTSS